jgi:hypothetical protein
LFAWFTMKLWLCPPLGYAAIVLFYNQPRTAQNADCDPRYDVVLNRRKQDRGKETAAVINRRVVDDLAAMVRNGVCCKRQLNVGD